MVVLPQPAQEVAKYKTRLLLEVSCHFGNLQYSTAQSLIHRGEKKEEEGEEDKKAEKENTFDWLHSTHLWISQAHCWQKFKQPTSNLFFTFSTFPPTTFLMSVATYRPTNSPECITPCISSCPQCKISKVMCCQYFPCPAGASPPQCRGASSASGAISNRILPTITHLYGNSHKGGKYRILLKFSAERLAAIHSSILTDERADSRGHMGWLVPGLTEPLIPSPYKGSPAHFLRA